MKKTIEQLHIAAQYLAAAGISFLDKKEDDSHTNLGWNRDHDRLETGKFGGGEHQVALNLKTYSIQWLHRGDLDASIFLNDATHGDVMNFLLHRASKFGLNYKYEFHYELPYPAVDSDYSFELSSQETLDTFSERLSLAQIVFESFLAQNSLESSVRVWPHHFDLGIYTPLDKKGQMFLGAGLAIPDSLVDDLYFYASGWFNGKGVDTAGFTPLKVGEWQSTNWMGATLASSNVESNTVNDFLGACLVSYSKNV